MPAASTRPAYRAAHRPRGYPAGPAFAGASLRLLMVKRSAGQRIDNALPLSLKRAHVSTDNAPREGVPFMASVFKPLGRKTYRIEFKGPDNKPWTVAAFRDKGASKAL